GRPLGRGRALHRHARPGRSRGRRARPLHGGPREPRARLVRRPERVSAGPAPAIARAAPARPGPRACPTRRCSARVISAEPPPAPEAPGAARRAVILASLLLATATTVPYLRASTAPPPGTAFVGFFYFVNDAYNYLSFTQQAEDGAFVFRNKLLE